MDALRRLIPERAIQRRVRALAAELSRDYRGRSPLFLGVLKGAAGSDKISVRLRPTADLQGRDVVVVEDIVDTGRTLRFLRRYVARRGPASLRVCALLVRTHAGNEKERLVDYRGFTVGEGWLVGYGLDCSEKYRALPDIYVVEGEQ